MCEKLCSDGWVTIYVKEKNICYEVNDKFSVL